jgi:hypothetical protein
VAGYLLLKHHSTVELAVLHLEELSRLANGPVPAWQGYLGSHTPDGLSALGFPPYPVRAKLV